MLYGHTLLNQFRAIRESYTVEMKSGNSLVIHMNGVIQLESVKKPLGFEIDRQDMYIAFIDQTHSQFLTIIKTLRALIKNIELFHLDIA